MQADGAPARILLIDDNSRGLAVRKYILSDLGYEIVTATSGEEGVEQFRSSATDAPFSLVVTDYRMPGGMRGDEVVRCLRQLAPKVPLVILSGFASPLALTPESTGADVVLEKGPHEQFALVETVLRLAPTGENQAGRPPASERESATGARRAYRRRSRTG